MMQEYDFQDKIVKGIQWIKAERFKKNKIYNRNNNKTIPTNQSKNTRTEYTPYLEHDVIEIYLLKNINDDLVKIYFNAVNDKNFWSNQELFSPGGNASKAYFFIELGLYKNKYFLEAYDGMKKNQTNEGFVWNWDETFDYLRVSVFLEPDSEFTKKALNWCLGIQMGKEDIRELCLMVLILTEYDYYKYKKIIDIKVEQIKKYQLKDGSWYNRGYSNLENIYYAIKVLCRIEGKNCINVKKAIDYLLKYEKSNRVFLEKNNGKLWDIEYLLLSLMMVSKPIGICKEEYDFNVLLKKQIIEKSKPLFIHTSPLYEKKLHVQEINNKVKSCFENSKKAIRIMSPYIDMHYESIMNLLITKPKIEFKIITRPKKDIKGTRERIAKNVLDLLVESTKGNLRTIDIIHSRLIIIDDSELIVSSADMTREGLVDEFNAGIYTTEKDIINNAIKYFENVWEIAGKEKNNEN